MGHAAADTPGGDHPPTSCTPRTPSLSSSAPRAAWPAASPTNHGMPHASPPTSFPCSSLFTCSSRLFARRRLFAHSLCFRLHSPHSSQVRYLYGGTKRAAISPPSFSAKNLRVSTTRPNSTSWPRRSHETSLHNRHALCITGGLCACQSRESTVFLTLCVLLMLAPAGPGERSINFPVLSMR